MHLYRRHKSTCKHRHQRHSRTCDCRIWAKGILHGEAYEKSLKTRSWTDAESQLKKIIEGDEPEYLKPKETISIESATSAFDADCKARQLGPKTLSKYRTLAARLKDHCAGRGISDLHLFTDSEALDFRNSWKGASVTLAKTLELARVMFRFFHDRGWVKKNFFKAIRPPKLKDVPRLPFDEKEIQAILQKAKDDRERAFLLTLRHTGLRIGDACLLRTSSFAGDRIHLRTTKAGTQVSIVIPPPLVNLLNSLPAPGGYFFIRGESLHPHTTSDSWRKRIKAICKKLKITPAHPHRFRHSLAKDLLMNNVSVENVAQILGNTPAIVSKVYAQWIAERQAVLDDAIKATWKKQQLALVKK